VRSAAWVVLVFALGGLAASAALGQSLPIPTPTVSTPTVSTPTVSVPSVTVPSVTVPPVTTPAPGPSTPPVQTPPAQTPPVQASAGGAVVGGGGGSGGGGTGSGGGGGGGESAGGSGSSAAGTSASSGSSGGSSGGLSATGSSGTQARGAASTRFSSTRWWIAAHGSTNRRITTLKFRLKGSGLVRFTVMQVSPVCRFVATFRVHGHAGVNRVRFGGRVHGAPLSAGTYRITARTRRGVVIAVTTLVVVDARAPSPRELAFARRSNVCGASSVLGAAAVRGSLAAAAGVGTSREASTILRNQRTSGKPSEGTNPSGTDTSQPVASGPLSAVGNAKSPIVIALLALAILMLGLAAAPRAAVADPRVMGLVAAHRVELAAAGTAALVAGVVAIMLA
jgi:hypothetical protein